MSDVRYSRINWWTNRRPLWADARAGVWEPSDRATAGYVCVRVVWARPRAVARPDSSSAQRDSRHDRSARWPSLGYKPSRFVCPFPHRERSDSVPDAANRNCKCTPADTCPCARRSADGRHVDTCALRRPAAHASSH